MPTEPPTRAACLTPSGAAAIAVLAVRGPRAWKVVRGLFHGRRPLPDAPEPGRFHFGQFGATARDEVVLAVSQSKPEPWLELHCHGGRAVVRLLLEMLHEHGVAICDWRDLEPRMVPLADALTARTAAILLDQYHGACDHAAEAIITAIDNHDLTAAGQLLSELADRIPLGRHLTTPWRVTIAGAPNVGKSSLVNALAGYPRCVVTATPGTTRDIVTTLVAFDGWPAELADTAGLRSEAETLEAQGIVQARAAVAAADVCVWVMDASTPPVLPPAEAGAALLVVNKIDLPSAWDLDRAVGAVRVSSLSGAGLAELVDELAHRLVPTPPPAGAAVPFSEEWYERVERAQRYLARGQATESRRVLVDSTMPGVSL